MSQAPAMPVFTDALIGDTTHLSTEEFGAYCLILFATWRNNGVPFADNDLRLARICRCTEKRWIARLRPVLVSFFDLSKDTWFQKRLQKQWIWVAEQSEVNSIRGKAGAQARWLKNKKPSMPGASAEHCSSDGNQNHNHKKEDSEANASGADAPPDRVKALFDIGCELLGIGARSLVGKARKQYGDLVTMEALLHCKAAAPSEPVEYFIGCLRQSKKENPHDAETRAFRLVTSGAGDSGPDSSLALAFLDPAGTG